MHGCIYFSTKILNLSEKKLRACKIELMLQRNNQKWFENILLRFSGE